jgi:hypothetical protein
MTIVRVELAIDAVQVNAHRLAVRTTILPRKRGRSRRRIGWPNSSSNRFVMSTTLRWADPEHEDDTEPRGDSARNVVDDRRAVERHRSPSDLTDTSPSSKITLRRRAHLARRERPL